MKSRTRMPSGLPRWLLAVLCQSAISQTDAAEITRVQTIHLNTGWNAVFLEVDPLSTEPSKVFAGTPIEIAATYFPNVTPVQYLKDPREKPWKQPGWGVWYADSRTEAAVTDLHAIHGNRGFLLYSPREFNWQLTGKITCRRTRWQPDSFNLIGMPVDPAHPPTLASYFSGSPARRSQAIYRLEEDRWVRVQDPMTTTAESGRAYWVYCKGGSQYQGPIDIAQPFPGTVDSGGTASSQSLQFNNNLTTPANVTVEHLNGESIPLGYVIRNPATLETLYPRLPSALSLTPIPAGEAKTLVLQVRREAMTHPEQAGTLRVTTDAGTQLWLPVQVRRTDLPIQP